MNIDEKRVAMKRAMRIPHEVLEDEEAMYRESVRYIIDHLRAVVHALRILGEPKTDDDYISLFGKSEEELIAEYDEACRCHRHLKSRHYDFWQTILENELMHAV